MTAVPLFDVHAHLYAPRWYPARLHRYLEEDFLRRTNIRQGSPDPGRAGSLLGRMLTDSEGLRTIRIMDRAGLSQCIILIVDWGLELGEPAASIETIHREILAVCRRSEGRLIGFAGLDPRRPDAPGLLRWASEECGAAGLKLHPTGSWTLDDPVTDRLVETAVDQGLPVLVHIGRTMRVLHDQHAQPHALVRLAQRFPHGMFIAGHSGFQQYVRFLSMDVPENVYFDVSGWQDWIDTISDLQRHLYLLLRAFPGRVCFGTDSPFYTFNLDARELRWATLVRECVELAPDELQGAARSILSGPARLRAAVHSRLISQPERPA